MCKPYLDTDSSKQTVRKNYNTLETTGNVNSDKMVSNFGLQNITNFVI